MVNKSGIVKSALQFCKKLGILGYSKRKNVYGLNPVIVSIFFISITLLLCSLARRIVKSFLKGRETIQYLILELIATFELCACCFELIIDNWGVGVYALFLFLLTIWWSLTWETESACPYNPLEELVEGTKNVKTTILIIIFQLLGAVLTFRYVQILWLLELVETHKGKATEECTADLQVDMVLGAVIEAVLTCLCRLVSRVLHEEQGRYNFILDAFFGTTMVVLAFNFSGGYFNPALATSLKYGCKGNTFLEHMMVYWIGSCLGSLLSVKIFRAQPIQNYVKTISLKEN